jgi:hypothetical protein
MIAQRVIDSLFDPIPDEGSKGRKLRTTGPCTEEYHDSLEHACLHAVGEGEVTMAGNVVKSQSTTIPKTGFRVSITDIPAKFPATRPLVLIVGIGFKAGQSNLVNSPGMRVAQSLMSSGKLDVMYADALVEQSAVPTIPRFDLCRWDKATLETFDRIIVSFKVPGLDMALLDKLDSVQVEKWYQWR